MDWIKISNAVTANGGKQMELIDRDALKSKAYKGGDWEHQLVVDWSDIEEAPAIEAVPVVHGRWGFTEYEFFTCTNCGGSYYNGAESTAQAESYLNSGNYYKYCHNCGAKMDGKFFDREATLATKKP